MTGKQAQSLGPAAVSRRSLLWSSTHRFSLGQYPMPYVVTNKKNEKKYKPVQKYCPRTVNTMEGSHGPKAPYSCNHPWVWIPVLKWSDHHHPPLLYTLVRTPGPKNKSTTDSTPPGSTAVILECHSAWIRSDPQSEGIQRKETVLTRTDQSSS